METADLTAFPLPRSSGGSLRWLTASMTAARRCGADPDGAFFLLVSWGGDEAEGADASAVQEADQKERRARARKRRTAAGGTAIGGGGGGETLAGWRRWILGLRLRSLHADDWTDGSGPGRSCNKWAAGYDGPHVIESNS